MSKELEYIEDLFNRMYEATKYLEENKDTIDTTETGQSIVEIIEEQNEGLEIVYSIKQELIKSQEMEKTLKIVFEKKVNILLLELAENVDEYNERIVPNGKLTQEDFDLLKEIL